LIRVNKRHINTLCRPTGLIVTLHRWLHYGLLVYCCIRIRISQDVCILITD